MSRERWATFDCYGTLIDWNGGIRHELARVFGEERADAQLERYHELEPMLQAGGGRSYREVMTEAMEVAVAAACRVIELVTPVPRPMRLVAVAASASET